MRRGWLAIRRPRPSPGALRAGLLAGAASLAGSPAFAAAGAAGGAAGLPDSTLIAGGAAIFGLVLMGLVMVLQRRARVRTEFQRQLFQNALDASGDARLVTGPDGTTAAATTAWCAEIGFDADDPLSRLTNGFFVGRDSPATVARLAAAAASGKAAHAVLGPARDPASSRRLSANAIADCPGYVVWSLGPAERQSGSDDAVLDTGRDAVSDTGRDTGRDTGLDAIPNAVRDAVRAEQSRIKDALGDGGIGFYSVDQDGRFVYVDDTVASWLGVSADELTGGGRRIQDFTDAGGGDPAPPADALRAEVTLTGAGGRSFPAAIAQTIVPVGDGGGFYTRSMVRDLSPAPEAEARADDGEVAQWESRFRRLFDRSPVGVALLDADGCISECNAAFATAMATDAEAIAGKALAGVVGGDDAERVDDCLKRAASESDAAPPIEVSPGDGETALALSIARFARDDDGVLVVHVLPIDEHRNIDDQVVQSQKMELVGQLAGGVAHDFNNLLTAMIGFCDLLLLRHSPKDQSFADIMQIKQNANRAANLVRQLLAFSRQQTLQPRVLNLTDILAELTHLLRRLIGASIDLEMVHGRDLGLVKVDQGQFEQVVINLAVNARDAMPDGGTLTIRTADVPAGDPRLADFADPTDADYVTFELSDTGCGIPKHLLNKIYEPFFTTKEVGEGTGLGLATVYGIIKQTGGHIFVDSETDKGTTFTIFLPRHEREDDAIDDAGEEAAVETRRDLTGVGTVLLVEDEDAVRLFGARALRNKGYEVIEAKNGEGALEVLKDEGDRIDLLITDVVMPGVDGPTLIRSVRESHPDMKVIFISGYTEDSFRKRLDDGVAVHFLPKPFSLQELAGKVKEVMVPDGP